MKITIHPTLIIRTPRFPINARLEDRWEELKEAIAESSDDFYQVIKDLGPGDLAGQPPAVRNTIWKYFNRARHRSTPFGSFAAVGMVRGAYTNQQEPLVFNELLKYHRFVNWPLKAEFEYSYEQLKEWNGNLFSNTTCYPVGGNVRYITRQEDVFEMSEIASDGFIMETLRLCQKATPISDVFHLLQRRFPHEVDIDGILASMIGIQLLFTSLDPSSIGGDYFQRIGFPLPKEASNHYIITERETTGGTFDLRTIRHLTGLISRLQQLSPQPVNQDLDTFMQRFRKKFDRREVPLMLALDPELGVGYGNMHQTSATDELISELAHQRWAEKEDKGNFSDVLATAISQCHTSAHRVIKLENLPVTVSRAPEMPLPNTFNCLFSSVDDLIFIEHIGGTSATSLAGRFTLAVDGIHAFTREMANLEQTANPDALFFDIGYAAETRADNVNRRQRIYPLQLSLLQYDTSDEPLTASDLLVSIKGTEIVLRSHKHGKRAVPRLASAYNHGRSDLPLFRFLCDLQQAGLSSSLAIRIDTMLPGLSHYPRIQYHNIVVSPEKWRIDSRDVPIVKQGGCVGHLQACLEGMAVSPHFRCGIADQMLYMDRSSKDDMEMLARMLRKEGSLLLEEVLPPSQGSFRDTKGAAYAVQVMATLTHCGEVYGGLERYVGIHEATRHFLPAQEWLYYEIFCHPLRMDELLLQAVSALLEQHGGQIRQWFFIRYDEGGDHLRVRFKIDNGQVMYEINRCFMELLGGYADDGFVDNVRIGTYSRELERYGSDMIAAIEQFFCQDSHYVLDMLRQEPDEDEKYRSCLMLMGQVADAGMGIPGMELLGETIRRVGLSLQEEHRLTGSGFARLNRRYRVFGDSSQGYCRFSAKGIAASMLSVIRLCPQHKRNRLFADLFHMHVNRLFSSHQRTHELVIYYFYDKRAKSKSARLADID